jgi:hypothetical protein
MQHDCDAKSDDSVELSLARRLAAVAPGPDNVKVHHLTVAVLSTRRDLALVATVSTALMVAAAAVPHVVVSVMLSARLSDAPVVLSTWKRALAANTARSMLACHMLTADEYAIEAGQRHNLNAVATQRQAVLDFVRDEDGNAAQVLFLDSDIVLRPDSLARFMAPALQHLPVLAAVYAVPWCAVPLVGMQNPERCALAALISPDAALPEVARVECVGFGATLLRGEALQVAVVVGGADGVKGEDVGFAQQCRAHGVSQHILTNHSVLHFGGGTDVMSAPCIEAILRAVRDTVLTDTALAAQLRTSRVTQLQNQSTVTASRGSGDTPASHGFVAASTGRHLGRHGPWVVLGVGLIAITAVGTLLSTVGGIWRNRSRLGGRRH